MENLHMKKRKTCKSLSKSEFFNLMCSLYTKTTICGVNFVRNVDISFEFRVYNMHVFICITKFFCLNNSRVTNVLVYFKNFTNMIKNHCIPNFTVK